MTDHEIVSSSFENPDAESDRGDTLIEVLIALVVIGVASVALLLTFSTTVSTSAEYQKLSKTDTVVRSVLEEATSQLQLQLGSAWETCTAQHVLEAGSLPTPLGYSGEIESVSWSNGGPFAQSPCPTDSDTALVEVLVTTPTSGTQTLSAVVNEAASQTPQIGVTPTQLVFNQGPGASVAGQVFSISPEVLVEAASNHVVTSDWSTVILEIKPGTGTAGATLNGCTHSEFSGEVTFSGCSISEAGSGYELEAIDTDNSVVLDPAMSSPSFTVSSGL